jgi:cob(I)alamin adenosyltransferase
MTAKLEQGLVQIYTGEGKGKTIAALGLALRALGSDLKVYMLQFFEGEDTGELHASRLFGDKFVFQQTGLKGFIQRGKVDPADVHRAREALKKAREIVSSGDYDLVILDEIIVALYFELISMHEIVQVLKAKAPHVEVVLTGRYAPPELIDQADLVTEIKNLKHYCQPGVPARRGIES